MKNPTQPINVILRFCILCVMLFPAHAFAACSNNIDGTPGQNGEVEFFTPAGGSGGCTSPTASEGALNYDTDRFEACDGNGWIDIGK